MSNNTNTKKETIIKRQKRDKEALLEQLRKMPVITIACERTGIGRTTFHRWCHEDKTFEAEVNKAMSEGDQMLNDVGKTQLIALIKDKKWEAVKYYLEKHHPEFLSEKNRLAQEKKSELKIIVLKKDEAQL